MRKLLIIDDEFIFRQGLRYMMDWEACGYSIIGEASNGQEGLEMCKRLRPDLILCDVVMPVLNGVEFVRQVQLIKGPPVIMLSNFDEYDKVRKAFQYGAADYILKSQVSKEILLSCLDRILSSHSAKGAKETEKTFGVLIRQVLDDYAKKPYNELSDYLKNRIPSKQYFLLLLDSPRLDFQSENHFQEEIERMAPCFSVCAAYTTQQHALALLGCPEKNMHVQIKNFINKLKKYIRHTSCALSLPFNSLSNIREIAESTYELTKYSILYEDKLFFCQSEIEISQNNTETFPSEEYHSHIAAGQLAEAWNSLLSYMETLKNTTTLNPDCFRKFTEHTFYTSLLELRKTSKQTQELSLIELRFFKRLDSALTFTHIRDALAEAFGELSSVCIKPRQEDLIINGMKSYLEENYSQQITLYDVAAHLHMNYSYLSAYISQNTGKHFSEHLNDTRIRHAKKMLITTARSISYISEAVGYTDQSYFGKIFKKYVGVTPLQYRHHSFTQMQEK